MGKVSLKLTFARKARSRPLHETRHTYVDE